jgi:plasmid stabilization system protein ParE
VAPERREAIYQRRASADAKAAYRWYEEQRIGLGEEFLAELRQAVDLAVAFPLACPRLHRNTRRVLLKRFPYGLYFRLNGAKLIIVSIYHASRDPEGWLRRS